MVHEIKDFWGKGTRGCTCSVGKSMIELPVKSDHLNLQATLFHSIFVVCFLPFSVIFLLITMTCLGPSGHLFFNRCK